MKKVSVIVPCHNAAKWLPQCFLSLAKQTIGIWDLELIFVDDASTDGGATWALLEEFERAYPNSVLIVHLEENMRQGGARNIAMQYATGEYLAFVDADDFVAEEWLELTYASAVRADADILQFEYYYYTERLGAVPSGRKVCAEHISIHSPKERKRLLMQEKITYGCWNKLYRRSMVINAGVQYAEHVIYEEPLFVYPLLFRADSIVIMEEPFYYYRQNHTGTMRSDMKDFSTLMMHAKVQKLVWDFMKETEYFKDYYEEIKLYFLHTYFYETLYFAKQRGFAVTMDVYTELALTVEREVPDYTQSQYAAVIPLQMELYRQTKAGMTQEWLASYMERL